LAPALAAEFALMVLIRAGTAAADEDAVARGEYLVRAGGCSSCHRCAGEQKLAGERALATPFVFYSANITPDPGIRHRPLDVKRQPR